MSTRTVLEAAPGALSDYYDWFKRADSGDVLVYWTGDLAFDRDVENFRDQRDFPILERLILSLDAVSARIVADATTGFLRLTQKRLGPSRYEYRAMRRRPAGERPILTLPVKVRDAEPALA